MGALLGGELATGGREVVGAGAGDDVAARCASGEIGTRGAGTLRLSSYGKENGVNPCWSRDDDVHEPWLAWPAVRLVELPAEPGSGSAPRRRLA